MKALLAQLAPSMTSSASWSDCRSRPRATKESRPAPLASLAVDIARRAGRPVTCRTSASPPRACVRPYRRWAERPKGRAAERRRPGRDPPAAALTWTVAAGARLKPLGWRSPAGLAACRGGSAAPVTPAGRNASPSPCPAGRRCSARSIRSPRTICRARVRCSRSTPGCGDSGGSLKSGIYAFRRDTAGATSSPPCELGRGTLVRFTVPEGLQLGEIGRPGRARTGQVPRDSFLEAPAIPEMLRELGLAAYARTSRATSTPRPTPCGPHLPAASWFG